MTTITSPMTGSVLEVSVQVGEAVSQGQQLLVLESMKMEFPVEADGPGTVASVEVGEGTSVQEGDVLLQLQ